MVVGRFPIDGIKDGIQYMNYQSFLELLWGDKLL